MFRQHRAVSTQDESSFQRNHYGGHLRRFNDLLDLHPRDPLQEQVPESAWPHHFRECVPLPVQELPRIHLEGPQPGKLPFAAGRVDRFDPDLPVYAVLDNTLPQVLEAVCVVGVVPGSVLILIFQPADPPQL